MSKESKTARASMVQVKTEKKVISDEQYVKNLRSDLEQGLYVAQEGARALLREYDKLLPYALGLEEKVLAAQGLQEEAAFTYKKLAELSAFLNEKFPNDVSEGGLVVDAAINVFNNLLKANESIAQLARQFENELEIIKTGQPEYKQ